MVTQRVDGQKIVVVGAGFVGSTFAYSLLIRGLASQIAVIDIIELPLGEKEEVDFQKSATIVKNLVNSLGL